MGLGNRVERVVRAVATRRKDLVRISPDQKISHGLLSLQGECIHIYIHTKQRQGCRIERGVSIKG